MDSLLRIGMGQFYWEFQVPPIDPLRGWGDADGDWLYG
jgi:hypothetical protein